LENPVFAFLQSLSWIVIGLLVATLAVRPIASQVVPSDHLPPFGEMLGEVGYWLFMSGVRMLAIVGGTVVVLLLAGFLMPKSVLTAVDQIEAMLESRVGAFAVPMAIAGVIWLFGFAADMRVYFANLRAGPPRQARRKPEPEYQIVHTVDPHTGRVTRQLEGARTRSRMTVMPTPPATLMQTPDEPGAEATQTEAKQAAAARRPVTVT
jgi:hypothetical protein